MYSKHSSFYYIFWISLPIVLGASLAWLAHTGAKIAYQNVFESEKTYIFNSPRKAALAKVPVIEIPEEKGSEVEVVSKPAIEDMQYSFVSTSTVAKAKESGIVRQIENILPKKTDLKVTALSFIAADLDSGEILAEKKKDDVWPIASVTKIVTALVSLNTLRQDEVISIPESAIETYGDTGGLKKGEKMSIGNLLYPMLLDSSNDAAEAVAQSHDREKFLQDMNDAVLLMGATRTSFEDASGLSPRNVSSAADLFKIAQYVFKKKPVIFDITRKSSYTLGAHKWVNPTILLKFDSYIGGKNGYTDEAERSAVSLFSIPQKNGPNRDVAIVILKSKDRNKDVEAIVNYIAQNVQFVELKNVPSEDSMEFY